MQKVIDLTEDGDDCCFDNGNEDDNGDGDGDGDGDDDDDDDDNDNDNDNDYQLNKNVVKDTKDVKDTSIKPLSGKGTPNKSPQSDSLTSKPLPSKPLPSKPLPSKPSVAKLTKEEKLLAKKLANAEKVRLKAERLEAMKLRKAALREERIKRSKEKSIENMEYTIVGKVVENCCGAYIKQLPGPPLFAPLSSFVSYISSSIVKNMNDLGNDMLINYRVQKDLRRITNVRNDLRLCAGNEKMREGQDEVERVERERTNRDFREWKDKRDRVVEGLGMVREGMRRLKERDGKL
jgi:hypothetical protein